MAALEAVPLWERICNAVISYCRYVRIMVWPDPLTAYYFHEKNNINILAAVLSAIAIVLVTAVCWHYRKEKSYCLFGWLWFLGALVPNGAWKVLFLQGAPPAVQLVENAVVGPLIAVVSFVCSIGNVPMAAILWAGGISFGGVIAFLLIFNADLGFIQDDRAYRR